MLKYGHNDLYIRPIFFVKFDLEWYRNLPVIYLKDPNENTLPRTCADPANSVRGSCVVVFCCFLFFFFFWVGGGWGEGVRFFFTEDRTDLTREAIGPDIHTRNSKETYI